jgi:CRISPR/Cas system-associated protein Cas5 (RAMP superfamily)
MSNEFDKLNKQVKFMESHIGGDLNDTSTEFTSQKNIIESDNNLFLDLLDDTNDLTRNKDIQDSNNKSSEYIQEKRKEYYDSDSRMNNFPTEVGRNINLSNPIIYPKEYDPYFEYLNKKSIKSINTQVIQKKTYINIDSANRQMNSIMNVESYIQLNNNPLVFTNGSSTMQIKLPDANNKFIVGDLITLQGYNFYTIKYSFVNFYFSNESNKVILDLTPNYIINIPYYNVLIQISGATNGTSTYFKNIPLNVINNVQSINLYTTESNEIKFSFTIPMNFYSDNSTENALSSACSIKYYFIGNYPINYINSGVPISLYNLNESLMVDSVDSEYVYIKLTTELSLNYSDSMQIDGNWINSSVFETGGSNIQIGKIINIQYSYPNSSNYKIPLEKRIDNVICIKIKSSEIPNTYKLVFDIDGTNNVTYINNVLYWENALDEPNNIYSITVPPGNYSSNELMNQMEKLISKVPRIINNSNIVPFNNIKIIINQNNNITEFTSYNQYSLPNSITNLITKTKSNNMYWILTIGHPNHNQNVGSVITIKDSINYKNIDSKYINAQHIVTKIMGNDFYEITLKNINTLDYFTAGNGGYSINITTLNPFKLYFNKSDTIGNILGFKNTGDAGSVTPYSNSNNNYTIDNSQLYIYGSENI